MHYETFSYRLSKSNLWDRTFNPFLHHSMSLLFCEGSLNSSLLPLFLDCLYSPALLILLSLLSHTLTIALPQFCKCLSALRIILQNIRTHTHTLPPLFSPSLSSSFPSLYEDSENTENERREKRV